MSQELNPPGHHRRPLSRGRIFIPPFGWQTQWLFAAAAVGTLAIIWSYSVWKSGYWDWLLISGWITLVIGLCLVHGIPGRFEDMLSRLAERRVLELTPDQLCEFKVDLERKVVSTWAPATGVTVAIAIGIAFANAFSSVELVTRIPLVAGEIIGGYVAGCYLGRMTCYGFLGPLLKLQKVKLDVQPGHHDTRGGLKPIGDFYFYQAIVVSLPAVFLAVWLLLFPLPYFSEMYKNWQTAYSGLLVIAVAIDVLAFVLPLVSFHREMVRQKSNLAKQADELSCQITETRRRLVHDIHTVEAKAKDSLPYWIESCRDIEQLPILPVDLATKLRFSVRSLALAVPALVNYTGFSDQWGTLLQKFLSFLAS